MNRKTIWSVGQKLFKLGRRLGVSASLVLRDR
jgi:hypothetical protein